MGGHPGTRGGGGAAPRRGWAREKVFGWSRRRAVGGEEPGPFRGMGKGRGWEGECKPPVRCGDGGRAGIGGRRVGESLGRLPRPRPGAAHVCSGADYPSRNRAALRLRWVGEAGLGGRVGGLRVQKPLPDGPGGCPRDGAGAIEPETCVGWRGGGGLATLLPLARPSRPLSRGRRKRLAGPWGLTDAPLR